MMLDLPSKIPRPTNRRAILLAESICPNPQLERVPVLPTDDSITNNCFFNVQDKVKQDGGQNIYGWQIWDRTLFIEAGFHAVWKKDESLLDITRKEENEILFFEDSSRKFEGYRVDNIRMNLSGNPLVDDLIKLHEILFMIEAWGKNRYIYDSEKPVQMAIPVPLMTIREDLRNRVLPELFFYIQSGGTHDSQCFCGRPLSYHSCHGEDLKTTYEQIKKKYADSINWD